MHIDYDIQPPECYLPFHQRLKRYTQWRTLLWIIGIQVVAIAAFAIMAQQYFFLFVAAFISLNLLNYFYFKKWVRYSLRSLSKHQQGEEEVFVVCYHDQDTFVEREVPRQAFRAELNTQRTRSGPMYFFRIYAKDELLVDQLCGAGRWKFKIEDAHWTKERCSAMIDEIYQRPSQPQEKG